MRCSVTADRPKTMAEAFEQMVARSPDPERHKRVVLEVAASAVRDFPDDPEASRFAAYAAAEGATVAEIIEATGLSRETIEQQIAAHRVRQAKRLSG
jgi:hypothetical protein